MLVRESVHYSGDWKGWCWIDFLSIHCVFLYEPYFEVCKHSDCIYRFLQYFVREDKAHLELFHPSYTKA